MTTISSDTERAEVLQRGIAKLGEAAVILNQLRDDPRVLIVLCQLEGMDKGWFHFSTKNPDYLVDLLIDLALEARGTPVEDHRRGHAMTREEAEAIVGKVAD